MAGYGIPADVANKMMRSFQERELHIERSTAWSDVLQELNALSNTKSQKEFKASKVGGDPKNVRRNRDKNFVPFDHNRIIMKTKWFKKEDYINASAIVFPLFQRKYILAALPPRTEFETFWKMIIEQKVPGIVLFSNPRPQDQGNQDVAYFPEYAGMKRVIGKFTIKCTAYNDDNPCEQRELEVTYKNKKYTIWHLQYHGWPQVGNVFDCKDFFLHYNAMREREMRQPNHTIITREDIEPHKCHQAVVVQCLTGAGPSATFLLFDLMVKLMESKDGMSHCTPTIETFILTLRSHRKHCVQTVEQYKFLYQALINWLLRYDNKKQDLGQTQQAVTQYVSRCPVFEVVSNKNFLLPNKWTFLQNETARNVKVENWIERMQKKQNLERFGSATSLVFPTVALMSASENNLAKSAKPTLVRSTFV